ncbi:MAG: hypothetical protein ABIG61_07225 [Planctomycetota bacterium]
MNANYYIDVDTLDSKQFFRCRDPAFGQIDDSGVKTKLLDYDGAWWPNYRQVIQGTHNNTTS